MKRDEFYKRLRDEMSGMPSHTIDNTISYYEEIISDAVEDGRLEEDVIASFGSVESIVNNLLKDVSIAKLVKEKVKPKRRLETWEIILIIVTSPLWIGFVIGFLGLCFGLIGGFWGTIVALWAVDLAFMIGGVVSFFGSFATFAFGSVPLATFYLGAGLLGIGLSIILGFAFYKLTELIIKLGVKIVTRIKKHFVGREKQA